MLYFGVFIVYLFCHLVFGNAFNPCAAIVYPTSGSCRSPCTECITQNAVWPGPGPGNGRPINVAQNRPSVSSSGWPCNGPHEVGCHCFVSVGEVENPEYRRTYACGANNGIISRYMSANCEGDPYNCFHSIPSLGLDSSYWFVDLGSPVSIRHVVMFAFSAYQGTPRAFTTISMWENFAKLMFLVDAELCAETEANYNELSTVYGSLPFPSGESDRKNETGIVFKYWCTEGAKRGRFFRIQKQPQEPGEALQVCEVQIFACPTGTSSVRSTWEQDSPSHNTGNCQLCTCNPYPCDNYYGCVEDAVAEHRATNILIHKHVATLPSSNSAHRPPSFLVDGVYFPSDFRCYNSLAAPLDSSSKSQHFAEINFGALYLVIKAKVVNFSASQNDYTLFQIWVANQYNQQHLCFEKNEPFADSFVGKCSSCNSGPMNCPRGQRAIFRDAGPSQYLKLCEIMLYGFPFKEIALLGECGTTDCHLETCAAGLECHNSTCLATTGQPCSLNSDCILNRCEGQQCKLPLNANCGQHSGLCLTGLKCYQSKCKFKLGYGQCTTRDECAQNTDPVECDTVQKCRQRLHSTCTLNDQCVAGAMCEKKQCICVPLWAQPSPDGIVCLPLRFNKTCSSDNECGDESNHMFCSSVTKQCECKPGFALNDGDFSCKIDIGQSCDASNPCSGGMICETQKCRFEIGIPCKPDRPTECKDGTVCDEQGHRCLYKFGVQCESSEQCQAGSFCEIKANTKLCKIPHGKACNDNDFCEANHMCAVPADAKDAEQKCVPVVGGACDIDRLCPNDTLCNDLSYGSFCRLDVLRTCSSSNTCREGAECKGDTCLWKIGSPCNTSGCGPDALCDIDNRCRYKVDKNCSAFPAFCQLRSFCNQANSCECLNTTLKRDSTCKFKSPNASVVSSSCDPSERQPCIAAGNAKCHNGTCVCNDGFGPTVHLLCQPKPGFRCTLIENMTAEQERGPRCAGYAVCEKNECVLPVGQLCVDRERSHCVPGTLCDRKDSLCRLTIGSNCTGELSDLCGHGTVCDQFKKCKLSTGKNCATDISCVVGATCNHQSGKCECNLELSSPASSGMCTINTGEVGGGCNAESKCKDLQATCDDAKCGCKVGFDVSEVDLTCKVAEGCPCTDSNNCSLGKVCDKKEKVCKRELGSVCDSSKRESTSCETMTICDNYACKTRLGGECGTEETRGHCQLGTVCDLVGICQKGFNSACSASKECGAGMICQDNKCQCNLLATTHRSGWCNPHRGWIGSKCSSTRVGDKCTVADSFCDEFAEICKCKNASALRPQNLTCDGAASLGDETPFPLVVLFAILGLLLPMCIIAAVVCRRKRFVKKDELMETMEERRQQLEHLRAEAEEKKQRSMLQQESTVSQVQQEATVSQVQKDEVEVEVIFGETEV